MLLLKFVVNFLQISAIEYFSWLILLNSAKKIIPHLTKLLDLPTP